MQILDRRQRAKVKYARVSSAAVVQVIVLCLCNRLCCCRASSANDGKWIRAWNGNLETEDC